MQITEYRVKAPVTRNLKAAFIADSHDKPYRTLVDRIKEACVDVIFCTGDIIYGHDDTINNSFDMLKELRDIAPVFMSLGNHEGGAVKKVRFNFLYSDAMGGRFGFTIPAYFAYDDVVVRFEK